MERIGERGDGEEGGKGEGKEKGGRWGDGSLH